MLLGSDRKFSNDEMTRFRMFTWCEICFEGDISCAGKGERRYFYRVVGKPREGFERIAKENGLKILEDKTISNLDSAYEEGYRINSDYGY